MERGGIFLKKNHIVFFAVIIFILASIFIPTVVAKEFAFEQIIRSSEKKINPSESVAVEINLFYPGGQILTISGNISFNNVNKLIKLMNDVDDKNLDFDESLECKIDILQDFNLISDEIEKIEIHNDAFKGGNETKDNNTSSCGLDFSMLTRNSFFGAGFGVGVGVNTHIPIAGWEVLGFFAFAGRVTIGQALGRSAGLRGLIFGGIFGFVGILMKVLIPYSYGPIIIGHGLSVFSVWFGTRRAWF